MRNTVFGMESVHFYLKYHEGDSGTAGYLSQADAPQVKGAWCLRQDEIKGLKSCLTAITSLLLWSACLSVPAPWLLPRAGDSTMFDNTEKEVPPMVVFHAVVRCRV